MGTFTLLRKCLASVLPLKNVRHQHVKVSRLFLEEFGDPAKVVKKEDFVLDLSGMKSNEVTFYFYFLFDT